MLGKQLTQAAAGSAAGEGLYVDDLFSTYLWEGDSTTNRTITNDIDLAGEGGLVWIKNRTGSYWNVLFDTERGGGQISSNQTDAELASSSNVAGYVSAYNSDGFSVSAGSNSTLSVNNPNFNYASWTFRKAPGFFDVVTYSGQSNGGVDDTWFTVSHSLGSTPGFILIKTTSRSDNWIAWHRSDPNSIMHLNSSGASNSSNYTTVFGHANGAADADNIYIRAGQYAAGRQGESYVAYIFGHDDQSFGTASNESIIKCGSYTGNGSTQEINLGWEPQWVLIKSSAGTTTNWHVFDNMRGINAGNDDPALFTDSNGTENTTNNYFGTLTATGFDLTSTLNGSGNTYVYMAIRRPHKLPTAATEVFVPQATRGAMDGTPSELGHTSNFPVDLFLEVDRSGGAVLCAAADRIRGGGVYSATNRSEVEASADYEFDTNEGVYRSGPYSASSQFLGLMFRRASGFMDAVTWSGTGSARTISHNLTVAPELIISKCRNTTSTTWLTYASPLGATKYIEFNSTLQETTASTVWNDTAPTSSVFTVGTSSGINASGRTYFAYLFASLPGISKIGTYTGTGTDGINVDCDFTAGARLVLVKRTDSNGHWWLFDSARGIVSGNDPYSLLSSTSAENTTTDRIDPLNAGFIINASGVNSLNASGGTYLFLAIA